MTTAEVAGLPGAQDRFVAMLPEIESRAEAAFRRLDPEAREDAVAEATALCWQNYLHRAAIGKPVGPASLAYYAALGVRSGRSCCGESSTDVLAPRTRLLGRATVESLDAVPVRRSGDGQDGWWDRSEALEDRRLLERPFERVRIKHDYGKFLCLPEVTDQERRVFNLLALGHGTGEIARDLQVSAPRACQIKHAMGRKLRAFMRPDRPCARHGRPGTPEGPAGSPGGGRTPAGSAGRRS